MNASWGGGGGGSVATVRFCPIDGPEDWIWGGCTWGCEAVALLARAVRHGGFRIGGIAFDLLGSLWPGLFRVVCFYCPLVYSFYLVVLFRGCVMAPGSRPYPPINVLSIVFQSPSSVKHCKVGTMRGGKESRLQEPLGIMVWASRCRPLMTCVFWCVAPAGFASGRRISCGWTNNQKS